MLKTEPNILDWITDALRHSHPRTHRLHEQAIERLQGEHDKLQKRLDAIYIDKLDGRVDTASYDRLAAQWQGEQGEILRLMGKHREATEVYFVEGSKILDLASRSQELFATQPSDVTRKLLDFVLSNCSWSHGELSPSFRKPFDLLVKTWKTVE